MLTFFSVPSVNFESDVDVFMEVTPSIPASSNTFLSQSRASFVDFLLPMITAAAMEKNSESNLMGTVSTS